MRELDYRVYCDKVNGAWLGKCAGGMIGAKQENNKNFLHYTFENVFPEVIPPNDDFDLQILFLQEVLEKRGAHFDSSHLADEFARHNKCWANEYRVAIRNNNAGIYPPVAGEYNNDFFKHSMGCPIRSELWALISPGDPDTAVRFAEMDGCVDHAGESIEGEKFLAAAEALAFFETDIEALLRKAFAYISEDCRLRKCVEYVFRLHREGVPLAEARRRLIQSFGSSDASYSVTNLGITVLALLYGNMDFGATMLTAVNCGYDTDCTSATAGSILGIILGKSGMPADWLARIGEKFYVGTVDIRRERDTLTALTEDTAKIACMLTECGVSRVKLTGMPRGCAGSYPRCAPQPALTVRYDGRPEIVPGGRRKAILQFKNRSGKPCRMRLSAVCPDYLSAVLSSEEIELTAGGEGCVELTVSCEEMERLPIKNIVTLHIAGDAVFTRRIGFFGAAKYRVYGPYFDNYDTTARTSDPFCEVQPDTLFTMFNGYADIDREYLSESFDSLPAEYTPLITSEDKLPIEGAVAYQGPCCVYVVYDFEAAEAMQAQLLVGFTAPHKIFLNGALISRGDTFAHWMPLNNTLQISLRKGKNRLVYKLLRKNGPFEFSAFLSQKDFTDQVLVEVTQSYHE